MVGVSVTLDIDDTLRTLSEAQAALENPIEMWDEIGSAMVKATTGRFDAGVTPEGNPWLQSIRVKMGQGNGQTLVDKGQLVRSITREASESGVQIGTNVIYAAIHQFGGTIRAKNAKGLRFSIPGVGFVNVQSVNIPARPFLGINAEDENEIGSIALRHVALAFGE